MRQPEGHSRVVDDVFYILVIFFNLCSYKRAKAFSWQKRWNATSRKSFSAKVGWVRVLYEATLVTGTDKVTFPLSGVLYLSSGNFYMCRGTTVSYSDLFYAK